jgi:hypothetical protein
MANRYWVGGNAAWDGTVGTKWATTSGGSGGASVPTSTDDVFFDAASGAITCTISTGNTGAKSITCTGFTGDLTGTASLSVSGGITLVAGMTYSYTGALSLIGTGTVTSAGKTLGNTTVNGAGITVTLGGNTTLGATLIFTLTQGTIDLAGYTLSTGVFSSSNTSTRSIAFGTGDIELTYSAGTTTVLLMATATNFTCTGTGGFRRNQAQPAFIEFGVSGGTLTNAPNLSVYSGASALTITSNSFFKNLSFAGSTSAITGFCRVAGNLTLGSGTYTSFGPSFYGAGTVTTSGKQIQGMYVDTGASTLTLADAITIYSTGTVTLYSGTINLAGFTIVTQQFNSSNSNTRAVTFGSGIIKTYAVAMADATGFTWTGTGGFNFGSGASIEFGTTGGTVSNAPNVNILSTSSASVTITSGSYINNLNFSSSSGFVSGSINVCGDLTLSTNSSGIYISFFPTFVDSASFTNNNRVLGNLIINGAGITVTLNDALSLYAGGELEFIQGTLKLKSGTSSTVGLFSTTGTTLKYLQSTTPGARATISCASGTNTATYLSIQDSAATGGALWDATSNTNVDAGNNSGWSLANGGAFVLF